MQSKQNLNASNFGNLTFGFDIGIASVGWAVLNETRIVDLGVRAFDKAETAKEGESLNLARRTARLMRRRLRRRAWRLTKVARLLKKHGLINDVALFKPENPFATSLWALRKQGLDRLLSAEEWSRVIYHLCKHRGFHWVSKAEKLKEDDSAGETGKVKKGLAATNKLMKDKGYRTAAEMVLAEFPQAQRNKQGEYTKALERELLSQEFAALFQQQRAFNNPHVSAELEAKLLDRKTGLFWAQKPSLSGEALLKMLGKCTFEKTEYRAPKASFTAERHVWLTVLNNNIKITVGGITRLLNEAERKIALSLPYSYADGELTYKQLGAALVNASFLSKGQFSFAGLAYPSEKQKTEEKAKNPEEKTIIKMTGWKELQKALKDTGLETEWQGMVNAAMAGEPALLDQIAWVLSIYKEDDEVECELNKLNLPNIAKMVDALLGVRFNTFSNLSLKALGKIVPHMEQGLRYDEACVQAGYHHSQLVKPDDDKLKYLPPFYSARDKTGKLIFNEDLDIPRNPVVLRALNQARKVCNALIKQYGAPYQVNIEMARDLSRPFDERKKIKDLQEEFRAKNEKDRAMFNVEFNTTGELKGKDFEKYQLYREQQGKCAYSIEAIDLNCLFDLGYVEIDHALPYSRSFDDSKNNRVLVLAAENRNKSNSTPFEYLDGKNNSKRWHDFEVWVNSNKAYRQAKRNRLLKKDLTDKEAEGMRERNLQDTRYICRFFKNYVEQFLQLADNSEVKRCVVVSGSLTSLLRAKWGLPNSKEKREKSDRHHALDAVVVGVCGHHIIKRLSTFVNKNSWAHRPEQGGYVNTETGEFLFTKDFVKLDEVAKLFPRPWKNFRDDLLNRLETDDISLLRQNAEKVEIYLSNEIQNLKPLFVSRAPKRRNSGAAHKETIYGKNTNKDLVLSTATKRKAVTDLKESDLDKIVGAWEPRNGGLIYALRQWLLSQTQLAEITKGFGKGKDRKDPTPEEQLRIDALTYLPRKPLKSDAENGPFTGPIIKKVKLVETAKSGAYIREGIAELGKVISTMVYRHNEEILFQPRYELPVEKLFGLAIIPSNAVNTGIQLYGNDVVKIEHPNLSHCYRVLREYEDISTKEKLIDVVAMFPNGVFTGYWAYFEPSLNRPVLQLHDSSKFFLLEANKITPQQEFTLIVKEKKTKSKDKKEYEYIEKSPPLERRAFTFSLEENIKRQISSAKSLKKLNVDVLGNLYHVAKEEHRGLA